MHMYICIYIHAHIDIYEYIQICLNICIFTRCVQMCNNARHAAKRHSRNLYIQVYVYVYTYKLI